MGLAAARPSSEQQPAHGVRHTSNLVGPVPPPILGLFSTATPPGPAWDLNSPAGPNHFCSSRSSWLYPSRASLRDGWPHFRVPLQPYKTAEGVSTGKPAAIVQDTQEEYKARVGCSPCRDSQCPRRVPADQKCRPAGGLRHGVENRSVRCLWSAPQLPPAHLTKSPRSLLVPVGDFISRTRRSSRAQPGHDRNALRRPRRHRRRNYPAAGACESTSAAHGCVQGCIYYKKKGSPASEQPLLQSRWPMPRSSRRSQAPAPAAI